MNDQVIAANLKQMTFNDLWKSLKYPELINLGKSDKTHLELLNNPETWRYLLKRDYSHPDWTLDETVDPKEYYEFLYWMGIKFDKDGGISIKSPKGAEEFIRNKFEQFVDEESKSSLTAILFGGSHRNSCMGIITGINVLDLIGKTIDIFCKENSESLTQFLEDYYEPDDTSFRQLFNTFKKIWIDDNEDHQPHILITPTIN